MKDVLEFDSIDLSFDGRKILASVYMKCESGQIVGLLGRNGTGKSTLMKVVFGTQASDHKHVRINGEPLRAMRRSSPMISYLPQDNLIPSFISIGRAFKLFGIRVNEITAAYPELKDMIDLKPQELSGGHKRLVEVLLVLKSRARFCLLDEPFSGLSPVMIERLTEILNDVKKGKGIIITDHLYRQVAAVSDHLYLLSNGKTYPVKDKEQLVSMGYLTHYE